MTGRDFCRALLASNTDVTAMRSSTLDELVRSQYAVVLERESERWVRAASDTREVAAIELDCLIATEGYDEWVAEVWSVAQQRRCSYTLRVVVWIDASASAERTLRKQ